jgi:2-C-methyl-D-erythritol 4-phosphate cytidylyltransferase
MKHITALIMAAGTGERFGAGEPKQFCRLGGRPMLAWSIGAFSSCPAVNSIALVMTPGLEDRAAALVEEHQLAKVETIIAGGAMRQESVRLGLDAILDWTENILVHDAARPCVTADLINRVCSALRDYAAVIPSVPVVDTLVLEQNGSVDAILDRSRINCVQTPQGFQAGLLDRAHRRATARGLAGSDDGSLIFAMGEQVKSVPGDPANIKITYQSDLKIAETILTGES